MFVSEDESNSKCNKKKKRISKIYVIFIIFGLEANEGLKLELFT